MLLIRKSSFIIIGIINFLLLSAVGYLGYYNIIHSKSYTGETIKYFAELHMFLSIIGILLLLIIFFQVFFKSRNILKELDKMIELSRLGNVFSRESLSRIGVIGEKIKLFFFYLTDINEKKSLKISTQSALIAFLLKNMSIPLLVTDVKGTITDASKSYLEISKKEREELVNTSLDKIVPEANLNEIVLRMEKATAIDNNIFNREGFSVVPILNKDRAISNLVFVFDKQDIKTKNPVHGKSKGSSGFMERIRKAFKNK